MNDELVAAHSPYYAGHVRGAAKSQEVVNDDEYAKSDNHLLGLLYFSRRDTRTWVPKRHGLNLNFARPAAYLWLAVIVAALVWLRLSVR